LGSWTIGAEAGALGSVEAWSPVRDSSMVGEAWRYGCIESRKGRNYGKRGLIA